MPAAEVDPVYLDALAIQWEGKLREGQIKNCAALARAGQVSRARLSQILSLLELAPAIQEDLLFLTCPAGSADPIRERSLRRVTKLVRWDQQQRQYEELRRAAGTAERSEPLGWRGASEASSGARC